MCARIASAFLGGLFVFLVATVAAFVYLEWWQALLASAATFGLLVWAGKFFVRSLVRRGLKGMASGMIGMKGRALHDATVRVHSVRATDAPADEPAEAEIEIDGKSIPPRTVNWYAIDLTITPDARRHSGMTTWDIDDLLLVRLDAPAGGGLISPGGSDEFGLSNVRVVEADGDAVAFDEDKVLGPRRLRFAVGVPAGVRGLKFRYYFETFGEILLPHFPQLPPAP